MFGLLMPKGVFRYAVMPEIGIRLHGLFMGGFHYIPFFIAAVYQMVGLLSRNHPYLNQSNMGMFGIRHVVFEAGRNIKFSIKNIDQIILFVAVLLGLIIFLVQILSLGAFLFFQPALASIPTNWAGFFAISDPAYKPHDLASMMLDMVFGVPYPSGGAMGFFESCIGSSVVCQDNWGNVPDTDLSLTTVPANVAGQFSPLSSSAYTYFPFPYHLGMHKLFQVYSNGLLVIAVVIASYFVVTILAETAQTGTPFGKRFNKTWAPLRIVVAFGLLMPLNVGLNSSQYVVLYAAKYGSAFASNGWRVFNETLTDSYLNGSSQNLITVPNAPDLGYLTQFMYVARTCKVINDFYEHQKWLNDTDDRDGIVEPEDSDNIKNTGALPDYLTTKMYALWRKHSDAGNTLQILPVGTPYSILMLGKDPEYSSVSFVFGRKNVDNTKSRNEVYPSCGEISLKLTDPRFAGEVGVLGIQEAYYNIILALWFIGNISTVISPTPPETIGINQRHRELANRSTEGLDFEMNHAIPLDAKYVQDVNSGITDYLKTEIASAVADQEVSTRLTANIATAEPILYSKGWAAAGLWYNRVAEMNGSIMAAAHAVPTIIKYPAIQEQVGSIKNKYDKEVDGKDAHKPEVSGVGDMSNLLKGSQGMEFASTLYKAEVEWAASGITKEELTGNAILDAISSLLGLDGLYDMRRNPNAHPLAMLVGIGRSLVESAVNSLGYAALSSVFAASGVATSLATVSGTFFVSIAMMGLTVGFVLFYVVPFLPFIYFFFAVGGWIKGIFEAMVGAPLWALAHIRIDGHGLSGSAAVNGYFLIFEVFLRPILIVFGLLASISIFAALVSVLNIIFVTVTANVGGFDKAAEMDPAITDNILKFSKSRIDEFFFTVIYAIIVYLIGMSSFKLIDNIPNNILRWMGQSVATFGDQRENPAEGLISKVTVGSQQSLSKIGGGLQSAVQGASKVGS